MTVRASLGGVLAAVLTAAAVPARAETNALPASTNRDAFAILRNADYARGNRDGVAWKVDLRVRESGGRVTENSYAVQARGFDVLAVTLSPPKFKGRKLLMNQGNMWYYGPDIAKPAPINQRQKLSGNASNGDLAATNYADDYDPVFLPDETVSNEVCWVFDLKARPGNSRCTYDRIRYWVSKARGVGVRGEYYTVSGKLFKVAAMEYDNSVPGDDGTPKPFISRMSFTSALVADEVTAMAFSEPKIEDIPASTFDVSRLRR
jgi:hypothetical protein